jgi:quinol monooxygenase YgiN
MHKERTIAGPIISVACFRPKKGKAKDLLKVVKDHLPVLRKQKLVTARKAIQGRAVDGSIIEIFEWKSQKAIEQAHSNPEVQKLWERYGKCCEYIKFTDLAEAASMFPGFEPVN